MALLPRLLLIAPLLLSFYAALTVLSPAPLGTHIVPILERGSYSYTDPASGETTSLALLPSVPVPIPAAAAAARETTTRLLRPLTVAFLPCTLSTSPVSRTHVLPLLTDLSTIHAVLLLESIRHHRRRRRRHRRSLLAWPVLLFAAGQVVGIGLASSLWCAAAWVLAGTTAVTSGRRAAEKEEEEEARYALAVAPAVVLGALVPAAATFFHADLAARHRWNWIWQVFPLTVGALNVLIAETAGRVVSFLVGFKGGDVAWLLTRAKLGFFGFLSAVMWVGTLLTMPYSMREVFLPSGMPASQVGFEETMRVWLQWDAVFMVCNLTFFVAYLYLDLKAAGLERRGWTAILPAALLGIATIGPGAMFAVAWMRREGLLRGGARARKVPSKTY